MARIYGLTNAMASEMLEITSSETNETVTALALNLEEDNIGAVIMGEYTALQEGDQVRRTGRVLDVPVGAGSRPRGQPARASRWTARARSTDQGAPQIESIAPGIIVRQPVKEPLQTGIKAIDSMIPIGRGQRELIIGDRGTGKTAVAIDTIINQKGTGVICIYVAIGQKASHGRVGGARRCERTARWTTRSSSSPPRPTRRRCSTSRPTPACAMAEYFM